MNDDNKYSDQENIWLQGDLGLTEDDADKIFNAIRLNKDNLLRKTLGIMGEYGHPTEQGLKILKEYASGAISYSEAIEKVKAIYQDSIRPPLLH